MNAVELADIAGVSYRQLDYWSRNGWVRPEMRSLDKSGYVREYSREEVSVAVRMGFLVSAGFVPEAAAGIARATLTPGPTVVELEGVAPLKLTIEVP